MIRWRSNRDDPTCFADDYSLTLQRCVYSALIVRFDLARFSLLPTFEHLRMTGSLGTVLRQKSDSLLYLPLDTDAVVFHMPTTDEVEITERLRMTNIHECSEVNKRFILSVYVSIAFGFKPILRIHHHSGTSYAPWFLFRLGLLWRAYLISSGGTDSD